MPTITVRHVPTKVVQSLKALARRHNRSMEQEVRRQARRPTSTEVDAWMGHWPAP
jgi:plasmid stability protein